MNIKEASLKSGIPEEELIVCYVYPDGLAFSEPLSFCSDDYEIRYGALCETCDEEIVPHYAEPLSSCECGTREWYI